MNKEDIRLGIVVKAQDSELYPNGLDLKGFIGGVTIIKENPNIDGTCIEVGGDNGYWFLPEELEEMLD